MSCQLGSTMIVSHLKQSFMKNEGRTSVITMGLSSLKTFSLTEMVVSEVRGWCQGLAYLSILRRDLGHCTTCASPDNFVAPKFSPANFAEREASQTFRATTNSRRQICACLQ